MKLLACICFILAQVAFLFAVLAALAYRALGRKAHTATAAGVLRARKYDRDVRIRGRRGQSFFIKHRTRGTYVYTVAGKEYRIRYTEYVPERQLPRMIPVVYLKRFPRIWRVDKEAGDLGLWGVAVILGAIGVLCLVAGIEILLSMK